MFGISKDPRVVIDLGFVHPESYYLSNDMKNGSIVFQVIRKDDSKFDCISVGGRYNALVNKFGKTKKNANQASVVGLSIALDKIINREKEISRNPQGIYLLLFFFIFKL